MKKFYLVVFLLISIVSVGISQKTLNDYSYVIVPEQYGFLKEKDKYQLNSLTKFLFNKYGFNAYFDREVPIDARRCDGLWAEIIGSPGFVYTRIIITLKDCYGAEVYRSEEGKSKEKDFKKAYYESMRRAFESVEALGVEQKEISHFENNPEGLNNLDKTTVVTEYNTLNETTIETNVKNLPASKYTTYSLSGEIYLLKKTKEDYIFYKESSGGNDDLLSIGKVLVSLDTLNFIDEEKNKYNAYFDDSNNFIVEKENSKLVYKLEN